MECANGGTAADVVFLLSNTDNLKSYGFEVMKQLIADAVWMLPYGGQVRVAMVSFAVHAEEVFSFTNTPDVLTILEHRFTGRPPDTYIPPNSKVEAVLCSTKTRMQFLFHDDVLFNDRFRRLTICM